MGDWVMGQEHSNSRRVFIRHQSAHFSMYNAQWGAITVGCGDRDGW
jgi:hypothetical protein